MARLVIALISVANVTGALAAPKASARGCSGALPTIEAAGPPVLQVRVQRPPRMPRREPFVPARPSGLPHFVAGLIACCPSHCGDPGPLGANG